MQIISPWNHGSSKAERQIQMIGNMINKHLMQKGASWPLYAAVSAYAMNTFVSTALQGLSPFELVFARKLRQLTSFELPKLTSFPVEYREFFRLLLDRAKMYRDMELEWRTLQALELRDKNKILTNIERAKEVTPDGLADTYEQLRNQIGLPNDACATPQKSSAAQLRIK